MLTLGQRVLFLDRFVRESSYPDYEISPANSDVILVPTIGYVMEMKYSMNGTIQYGVSRTLNYGLPQYRFSEEGLTPYIADEPPRTYTLVEE